MSDSVDALSAPLADLSARGLLHQTTDLTALSAHLASPRSVYCGFDPTRDSLTIGNFVSILMLRRFQLAGHKPVVLMGGGTGLVGDPSGKDAERQLLSVEQIEANVAGQRPIFESVLDFSGPVAARVVNNADWLRPIGYLEMLRDTGKYFSVNMMIQKDSVKKRLEEREQGISYTEFSYMILQAHDYAHLAEQEGVTVQMGGSDQWGNITLGVELARRKLGREVHGLTTPLITKSDGGKFGKSESGAVWLTANYTSPYAFYQFWLNASDADVGRYLRVFSLRPLAEIEATIALHEAKPEERRAQKELAAELTELLHGESALREAEAASQALFGGDVRALSPALLKEVFASAPSSEHERSLLEGAGTPLVDLLVTAGVAKSKREARQFLESGAIAVNGERAAVDAEVTSAELLHGSVLLLRRGKKNWHVCQFA